jgi:outer membrane protein assembly factor BamE (lipoprotein component of BamABCDE complex)
MKMALATMLVALALMFGATGCLIIPTLHKDSGYARTNVNQQAQEQFMPGRTTREDVIMALGEPDAVSIDEHYLAYRSEKVVAVWLFAAGAPEAGGGATGGTIYRERLFVFEFDPQGRFQTVRQSKPWAPVQGEHAPDLPNSAYYFLGASNRTVAGVSQVAFWLPDINGFQGLKGQFTVGKAGQLLLTESNLVFSTGSHFANTEPELKLPLTSITSVCVAKYSFCRRLVVQTDAGKVHSFEIIKPSGLGGVWQDKPAMLAACDFIRSKIEPTQLKK